MREAKTIGFSVLPDQVDDLQEVADFYGHGNRSEFLRIAVAEYRARMREKKMQARRAEARRQLDRTLSEEEVRDLVRGALANA